MVGTLQPLDQKFAVVDNQGRPTDYFTRWAQQRQIDIGDSITLADLQDYLTAHALIPGVGIQFAPDGNINNSPTIHADVQEILDEITATRGAVLYRGLLGWAALLPGTTGNFLQTAGAGADPIWAPAGGGGGGSTPTIRSSNIQSSSASSYVVPWPAGTIAGDVVVVFVGHAFSVNNPAGWAVFDNSQGGNFNGAVFAKVMTAADITAGSVTITTSGVFNGVLSAVTLTGTTVKLVRMPATAVRSSGGILSAVLVSNNAGTVDRVLAFIGTRGATNCTFSAGFTSLQAINAANASGATGNFTGVFTQIGMSELGNFAIAGSGYYTAVIAIQGP